MKLTLDQKELEEIVIAHVRDNLSLGDGKVLSLELINSRNPTGTSVTIDISDAPAEGTEPMGQKGKKPATKTKLVEVVIEPEVIADPVTEEADAEEAEAAEPVAAKKTGDSKSLFSKNNS